MAEVIRQQDVAEKALSNAKTKYQVMTHGSSDSAAAFMKLDEARTKHLMATACHR